MTRDGSTAQTIRSYSGLSFTARTVDEAEQHKARPEVTLGFRYAAEEILERADRAERLLGLPR
jgi:hypothetical protein